MPSSAPTEVAAQLERLAEQAPRRLDDPELLWSRGRRRHRARLAGTAACLALFAVLGAVAIPPALQRTQGTVAASPSSGLVLPDLVRQPGEYEPAFPEAPGPLVAVGVGTRGGWWSSRNAWWGVSAATGECRFLELPDAVVETSAQAALSADGRRLAYWFTGDTTGDPVAVEDEVPVVGVAVLDLVTGEDVRWRVDAPRGMGTDGLIWAGDVLWWSGGAYHEDSTPTGRSWRVAVHTWDLRTGEREDLDGGNPLVRASLSTAAPTTDGILVTGRRGIRLVQGGEVVRTIRPDVPLHQQSASGPALSPDGARLAGVHDLDPEVFAGEADPLVVGDLGARTAEMNPVGDVETAALHGWRSDDEVVVETYTGGEMDRVYGASVVDIETGEVTPLLDFRGNQPRFAADAWSADVVEAPDAPWAPDPRVVALVMFIAAWLAVKVTKLVRRRRAGP
jgi:hypothetical protein